MGVSVGECYGIRDVSQNNAREFFPSEKSVLQVHCFHLQEYARTNIMAREVSSTITHVVVYVKERRFLVEMIKMKMGKVLTVMRLQTLKVMRITLIVKV